MKHYNKGPKILIFDIETAPLLSYTWGIWEQNISLNQIKSDWHVLSWAAKWLGDSPSKIMYMDQRDEKNVENDYKILKGIWDLLNEADVVITQNGKSFDQKKLNARFVINKMQPPSPYKHIDTKRIATKNFAFTSNKLEYMSDKLNLKYKKLKHHKFSGFELWKECLAGNLKAWKEMEKYNKYDVLSLEELYTKLQAWDNTLDFNIYSDDIHHKCNCGSDALIKHGFRMTKMGKYQRYKCEQCGRSYTGKENMLSKEKRASLKTSI